MREPPNWILRIAVPLLLVGGGVALLFAVLQNTKTASQGSTGRLTAADSKPSEAQAVPPAQQAPESAPAAPAPSEPTPPERVNAAESAPAEPAPVRPAAPVSYTVRRHPAVPLAPLGSTMTRREGGTYEMELQFAAFGAGLGRLTLANHTEKILKPERKLLQDFYPVLGSQDARLGLAALSAKGLVIDGVEVGLGVDLTVPDSTLWQQVQPGEFVATIVDPDGREVVRVTRKFVLGPGSYEFTLEQKIVNLTDRPLKIAWHQIGPVDQPPETVRYGGDPRNVRFGYMADPIADPAQIVQAGDGSASLLHHADALGTPDAAGRYPPRTLWPNRASEAEKLTLAWAAMTGRYFTVAVMPLLPPPARDSAGRPAPTTPAQRVLPVSRIERVAIPTMRPPTVSPTAAGPFGAMGMELVWPAMDVAPGATADVSVAVYAGPTTRRFMDAEPVAARMSLSSIRVYTFGGPCAFCTFQSITYLLRWFLGVLHDNLVFDWSLAIILLVVCVRTLLHPVTRWSQTNMIRFSKSLQKLAPKQKAIQEQYGNDPVKMRQETARLMKEEGVSFGAGAMGCLPAFLQMPVWLALAPMLYFTFELRHSGAFFGLFQAVSGGKWSFFADLAEPDHFLAFGREFHVPLISGLMGPIDGLNVMPLLMGVVFYIQQKYLQPPQATPMTPEQEQQMKIMKIMTVVLFPLMMYNAPSGLALYFFTNSTLAILESKHIRHKAEKIVDAELAAKEQRRASRRTVGSAQDPDRKMGFLERMAKLAEERQKMMEEARKLQARRDKGRK